MSTSPTAPGRGPEKTPVPPSVEKSAAGALLWHSEALPEWQRLSLLPTHDLLLPALGGLHLEQTPAP